MAEQRKMSDNQRMLYFTSVEHALSLKFLKTIQFERVEKVNCARSFITSITCLTRALDKSVEFEECCTFDTSVSTTDSVIVVECVLVHNWNECVPYVY